MAEDATRLPKALKILSITAAPRNSVHTGLLGLPREIRDIIWSLVFDDLPLLERTHVPSCGLFNPNADYTTPPAVVVYRPGLTWLRARSPVEEACLRSCVRRKGFGVFAVNKQVHAEVSKTWSQHAVHLTFLGLEDMLDSVETFSQAIAASVQCLTLHELHAAKTYRWGETSRLEQRRFFDCVIGLGNLQRIELPYTLVRGGPYWMVKLAQRAALQSIGLVQCPTVNGATRNYEHMNPAFDFPYSLIGKTSQTQRNMPCAHNTCPNAERSLIDTELASMTHWCDRCRHNVDWARGIADTMHALDFYWRFLFEELPKVIPTHSAEQPYRTSLLLASRPYELTVYGLPQDSLGVRRRRVAELSMASAKRHREEARKQASSHLRRNSSEPNDVGAESDPDDFRPSSKAAYRVHTRVEKRRDGHAQKQYLEHRLRRNANIEKRERLQRASDSRKEIAEQGGPGGRVEDDRKSAGKPVGRN